MTTETKELIPQKVKYIYEDLLNLPDDLNRYEIIEGELYMTPAPSTKHQGVQRELGQVLYNFIKKRDLGTIFYAPCDVVLSNTDVVEPDLLFISKKRKSIITEKNIQGAPDLVVEIISPNTKNIDRINKKKLYEKYGVREYWIVDPEDEKVEVWTLEGKEFRLLGEFTRKQTLKSKMLSGVRTKVDRIFAF